MELTCTRSAIDRKTLGAITGLALCLLGAGPALAETCYTGGAGTGSLEFSGAVEGSGFSGRFDDFTVRYCMPDGAPACGAIDVTVQLASADSGNRDRDEALLGPEFFDVERFAEARWSSGRITQDGEVYTAEGELTLRDITAAQAIVFELRPDGEALVAAGRFEMAGSAEVERLRFDVGTGEFADPEFVRNRVDVRFELRLVAGTD